MPAPRFLDRLDPDDRARLEPLLLAEIATGRGIDKMVVWCQERGMDVGRTALANYMREVRAGGGGGPEAAEDPGRKVRREVAAQAPAAEEVELEEDADHAAALRRQIRDARRMALTSTGQVGLAARKLEADLQQQLREHEREQRDPKQGPRIVFYFPERTTLKHLEAEDNA